MLKSIDLMMSQAGDWLNSSTLYPFYVNDALLAKQTDQLTAITQEEAAKGIISEEESQKRIAGIQGFAYETPTQGFVTGIKEGEANVRNAISSTLTDTLGVTSSIIPTWVWALIGVGVTLYIVVMLSSLRRG